MWVVFFLGSFFVLVFLCFGDLYFVDLVFYRFSFVLALVYYTLL